MVAIRDPVQTGSGDEGWAIHVDGSLWYRGRVMVPQSIVMIKEILKEFHSLHLLCIRVARRCIEIFITSITGVE